MSDVVTAAPTAPVVSPDTAAPATPEVDPNAIKASAAPKKAPELPSTKKKFNLKVDGKDEQLELDLANEEELKKHLQMSRAAQKRMQQFSEYEKGVKGLFETLKNDPLKVLSDPRLGIPDAVRKKLAESIINNEIEEMQKSPEQRKREDSAGI